MPNATVTIRRASSQEIMVDRISNPTDLWFPFPLDMTGGRVAQAATALWGGPVPSAVEGESLWRLRVGEGQGYPAYISIGLGEPSVLFSAGRVPETPDVARELVGYIREMLSGVGGDEPGV